MEDRTITLVAKQPLTYAGRNFEAGDVFSAQPIDAAVLTYRRKAKFAPRDAPMTPDGTDCPGAEGHPGVQGEPGIARGCPAGERGELGEGDIGGPEPEPEAPRRRRRYRTRQMKAEA